MPVVGELVAQSVDEAVNAAGSLGYPVVLKVESPDLPHKTEAGVVRLNLRNADEVREAYQVIMARANAVTPPPRIAGVLVQKMMPQGIEMVVGARIDPLFGPLVVVGLGGILVELLQDTALAPAPVTHDEALALLGQLKGARLLDGFRGMPAVDRGAAGGCDLPRCGICRGSSRRDRGTGRQSADLRRRWDRRGGCADRAEVLKRIAVIGAGIVGVSCALHLQRDGHAVTLLDPRAPGTRDIVRQRRRDRPCAVAPNSTPAVYGAISRACCSIATARCACAGATCRASRPG